MRWHLWSGTRCPYWGAPHMGCCGCVCSVCTTTAYACYCVCSVCNTTAYALLLCMLCFFLFLFCCSVLSLFFSLFFFLLCDFCGCSVFASSKFYFFYSSSMTQKREPTWVFGTPMKSNTKVKCVFCDMTYNGLSIFV